MGPPAPQMGRRWEVQVGAPRKPRPSSGSQGCLPSPSFLKWDVGLDTDDWQAQKTRKCLLRSAAPWPPGPSISTWKSTWSFALDGASRPSEQHHQGVSMWTCLEPLWVKTKKWAAALFSAHYKEGTWKSKRVPEKYLLLLYWLCQSLRLCGSQQTRKFLKRWEYRPPDLPLEKPVYRLRSNS